MFCLRILRLSPPLLRSHDDPLFAELVYALSRADLRSRDHNIFLLKQWTQQIRAAMRQTPVIYEAKFAPKGHIRWRSMWGSRDGPHSCEWANGRNRKPGRFYCRVCRKDVDEFVVTHSQHEILRHFQGGKHFARDQQLRLETPGWRVIDFECNISPEVDVEWQLARILRVFLAVSYREDPPAGDILVDGSSATDWSLPMLAQVSSLVVVLQLVGKYELVQQLGPRFIWTAVRVNVHVTSSRKEVVVSVLFVLYFSGNGRNLQIVNVFSVHYSQKNATQHLHLIC